MKAHHFAIWKKTSESLFLILLLVQLPYYLPFEKFALLWAEFFFTQFLKWRLLAIYNMSQDILLET